MECDRSPVLRKSSVPRTLDASNTAKVEIIAALSALESRKALETCEAAKLLHLLLLGLLLLKTKQGRETVLLRLLGLLLLHALKPSNAIHRHTLESSELLKATHAAALKQHRELLLLKLLLKHGLLLPLGHEGKLKLILLLLLLWIGRAHIVEAVGAGITITARLGGLGLLEKSGESVGCNIYIEQEGN